MSRRRGFTLIEIMIVVAVMGTMAAMLIPRISFYFEPPSVLLRRSIEEAENMALSGTSIRFVLKTERDSQRGTIAVEALTKQETDRSSLGSFLGTARDSEGVLAWTPVRLSYPPSGDGWSMEPNTVYFFTDGSCTPARITWAARGTPDRDADHFMLTVTGYCVETAASDGG